MNRKEEGGSFYDPPCALMPFPHMDRGVSSIPGRRLPDRLPVTFGTWGCVCTTGVHL